MWEHDGTGSSVMNGHRVEDDFATAYDDPFKVCPVCSISFMQSTDKADIGFAITSALNLIC